VLCFGSEFEGGIWIDALQMFAIHDRFLKFSSHLGIIFSSAISRNISIDRSIDRFFDRLFSFFSWVGTAGARRCRSDPLTKVCAHPMWNESRDALLMELHPLLGYYKFMSRFNLSSNLN